MEDSGPVLEAHRVPLGMFKIRLKPANILSYHLRSSVALCDLRRAHVGLAYVLLGQGTRNF